MVILAILNKWKYSILISITIILFSLTVFYQEKPTTQEVPLLEVNGKVITSLDVRYRQAFTDKFTPPEIVLFYLLIPEIKSLQEAERRNISASEEEIEDGLYVVAHAMNMSVPELYDKMEKKGIKRTQVYHFGKERVILAKMGLQLSSAKNITSRGMEQFYDQ